jgi:zinc transport system substrate-binding protein
MIRAPMIRANSALLRLAAAAALAAGAALAARADAPRVVADIPPVHALTARAMAGIGAPELIVPPGASPHGLALRPSQARALADAALVVWAGPALTPWLEGSLDALAPEAARLTLLEIPGLPLLGTRTGAAFEAHEHAHDGGGHYDDEGHEAHQDQGHHHDHDHDEHHDETHGEEAEHAHALDPHAWLDPQIAAIWLAAIAERLADLDPEHAAAYAANAEAGAAELGALEARIDARLAPVRGAPFIVFHDAYAYFERRFDMPAAGAVSLGDGRAPGAARVADIRGRIEAADAVCVFSEPQFEPKLVTTLVEGTGARRGVLDPLGAELEPGAELYPALIEAMAASLADCLSAQRSQK